MTVELLTADWPAASHVIAGSTLRHGGVSAASFATLNIGRHVGDRDDHVRQNRRRLVEACALPGEPKWLNQVHGVRAIESGDPDFDGGPPEADAVFTKRSDDVIAVLTADCLPLLLCSREGSEVAAIHCGWRGLVGGVIANAVAGMSTTPSELLAWLGPAISQTAFEVGSEVRDAFLASARGTASCFDANDNGRWQADLYGLARQYLTSADVTEIYGGGLCTYSDPDRFFSYRRDGQTGRMATFIYMQS